MNFTCPVCKKSDTRFFAKGWDSEYKSVSEKFDYYYCNNCPVIFLPNPPVNRLQEIYPSTYYAFEDEGNNFSVLGKVKHVLEKRFFHRLLSGVPGEQLSVLDIGGGSGWLLETVKAAESRIAKTAIVDPGLSSKLLAEKRGHIFYGERIEDFKANEQFDFILLLNLIEHVADPELVMRKLQSLVKPNGLILVKTPNIDTIDLYLFKNHNWGGLHCPRHWVLFNKESLTALANQCELEVASAIYTQGSTQWTASILGWLSDEGLITVTRERPMHHHWLYKPLVAVMAIFDFARLPFSKTTQMFFVLKSI